MDNFVVIAAGVFGALVGSFLNVVVWRLPRGESLSHPASHCPRCDAPIRWFDNVPVLSWLVLRAKCRDCGNPISARYPAVELATALAFAGVAFWVMSSDQFGDIPLALLPLIAFLYMAAISIALVLIDLEHHTLPNKIVLPAFVVLAVLLFAHSAISADWGPVISGLIGAAALFVAYLLMAIVYPGGMGMGDVKLAGVLGLALGWVGWGALGVGAFAPFLLGGIFSLVLVVTRKAGRKSRIPFGPWMLVGAWVGIVCGETIAGWYLGLFGLV